MHRYSVNDGQSTYTRINKRDASKRFDKGETFYIIAHKMRPGYPFSLGMMIDPKQYIGHWTNIQTAFDSTVNNFEWYNANCYETGYYSAFYVVTERE